MIAKLIESALGAMFETFEVCPIDDHLTSGVTENAIDDSSYEEEE